MVVLPAVHKSQVMACRSHQQDFPVHFLLYNFRGQAVKLHCLRHDSHDMVAAMCRIKPVVSRHYLAFNEADYLFPHILMPCHGIPYFTGTIRRRV